MSIIGILLIPVSIIVIILIQVLDLEPKIVGSEDTFFIVGSIIIGVLLYVLAYPIVVLVRQNVFRKKKLMKNLALIEILTLIEIITVVVFDFESVIVYTNASVLECLTLVFAINTFALFIAGLILSPKYYNFSISDELIKLDTLRERGIITDAEFQAKKEQLMNK
jgi:hypothetical protein